MYVCIFAHCRVGFPEVKLGLLPGAQGTIRLPRLTGLALAMRIITTGDHINAPDALKYGIVDQVSTKLLNRVSEKDCTCF